MVCRFHETWEAQPPIIKVLKKGSCFLYPLNADMLHMKSKPRSTALNSAQVMHTSYVLCMQLQNERQLMTTRSGKLNILKYIFLTLY